MKKDNFHQNHQNKSAMSYFCVFFRKMNCFFLVKVDYLHPLGKYAILSVKSTYRHGGILTSYISEMISLVST